MAIRLKSHIKNLFKRKSVPTEEHFVDLIDTLLSNEDGARIKAAYESQPNTNAYSDEEKSKVTLATQKISLENGSVTNSKLHSEVASRIETNDAKISYTDMAVVAAHTAKLITIEEGATGDLTAVEVESLYESRPNTNKFTNAEKSKLASMDTRNGAPVQSTAELVSISRTVLTDKEKRFVENEGGDFYYDAQYAGYIDANHLAPNDQVGGIGFWIRIVNGGSETAASIKSKYESNPDTNPFTDAEKLKLDELTGGTIKSYSNKENLFLAQGVQKQGNLYRISDGLNDFWVEYLGTLNGNESDYKGWPKATSTISYILDTTGTGEKASIVNIGGLKTIKRVIVQVSTSPNAGNLVVDIQKNGSSIFSSKPTIYPGVLVATSGVITVNTIDYLDKLSIILESINSAVNPQIEIEVEYDDIKVPFLEELNRPVFGTITATGDDVSFTFTGDINAEEHEIEFHNGNNLWATVPGYNGSSNTVTHSNLADGTYYYRGRSLASGKTPSGYVTGSIVVAGVPEITYAVNDDFKTIGFYNYSQGQMPNGYGPGGTHNASCNVTSVAEGVRFRTDGTAMQIQKYGVLTPNQVYNYEIDVASVSNGTANIQRFISPSTYQAAILLNAPGIITGTINLNDHNGIIIARTSACDIVIRSIKFWI